MDQINTVIVDDDYNVSQLLEHYIANYCPSIKIVGVANTRAEAVKIINELSPDLLLLDVVLDDGNAFDLLKEVGLDNMSIVFITGHDNFAIKAFEVNALDYLLKPVDLHALIISINKVRVNLNLRNKALYENKIKSITSSFEQKRDLNFIAISSNEKIEIVDYDNIVYIKSEGRYSIFNLKNNNSIVSVKNIGEYEIILENGIFCRIHNSYIINIKNLIEVDRKGGYYCVMVDGTQLPVSRRRIKNLEKKLRLKG